MAVGCWQPAYSDDNPFGDVHQFRMSLWAEHFGKTVEEFVYPVKKECLDKVKEMADENWKQYMGPPGSHTPGQIVRYPLDVLEDGTIQNLEDCSTFPDFEAEALIMGKEWSKNPNKILTT